MMIRFDLVYGGGVLQLPKAKNPLLLKSICVLFGWSS